MTPVRRVRGTVSYVGTNGAPTITSEYEFDSLEVEILALSKMIVAEAQSASERLFAPIHALAAVCCVDPVFVEWITDGMFTVHQTERQGILVGTRPEYEALLSMPGWWNGSDGG